MQQINFDGSGIGWSNCILDALEKAERMAVLHNTPCHLVESPKLAIYKVKLDMSIRPADVILETVNPPSKRQFK
jgi:hypothetical protein